MTARTATPQLVVCSIAQARCGRLRTCGLLAFLLTCGTVAALAGETFEVSGIDEELRAAGFTDAQAARAKSGALTTRLLPTRDDNAAFVAGVVRIDGKPGQLVGEIDSLGKSDARSWSERVLQSGRFSSPPTPEDLESLRLENQDLGDLRRCRVGDCDLQIDRRTMALARVIGWRQPGAEATANALLKAALLERASNYLREGASAMGTYDDGPQPEPVAAGLARIIRDSSDLIGSNPSFHARVFGFPRLAPPPGVSDFVFWSKERALKPVVSIVHAFVQDRDDDGDVRYSIALKHVYDSHYYLAYVEFATLRPQGRHFYLLRSVRALINPPRGWLRALLLGRIKRAVRDQLAEDLARTKRRAEAGARSPR